MMENCVLLGVFVRERCILMEHREADALTPPVEVDEGRESNRPGFAMSSVVAALVQGP